MGGRPNAGGGRRTGGGNRAVKGEPKWKAAIKRSEREKAAEKRRGAGSDGSGGAGGKGGGSNGGGAAPRPTDAVSLGADAAARVAAVLREVAAAAGEEPSVATATGADAATTGVDPRSVDAKAATELLRKGFADAAAAAALAATRAAARASDATEGFNEQRRRRVQRALDWLVVHAPDHELPPDFASQRPKPVPPPPRAPIVRKGLGVASAAPTPGSSRQQPQPQQRSQQPPQHTQKHEHAEAALVAAGWPQRAVAQALAQALERAPLAAHSPRAHALAALPALAQGAARMFNASVPQPTLAEAEANRDALREELTAVDAISGCTALAIADGAPLPERLSLPVECGQGRPARIDVRVRLSPGSYPDHVPAIVAEAVDGDGVGDGDDESDCRAASWFALLSRRLIERAAEMRGVPMLWELMEGAAELAASGELERELKEGRSGHQQQRLPLQAAQQQQSKCAVQLARLALEEAEEGAEGADGGDDESRRTARLEALLNVASGPRAEREPQQELPQPPLPTQPREQPQQQQQRQRQEPKAVRRPNPRMPEIKPLSPKEAAAESARLREDWQRRLLSDGKLRGMRERRAKLPAWPLADTLARAVRDNRVVVVCGETGCGKSTQLPQFLLEDAVQRGEGGSFQMVVTQPRRIAATGVAMRVAQERAEDIGGTVGYSIRLETKRSKSTRVLFCTTGVLLRRLADDKALVSVSVVCVDEVHERSLDSDFLLVLLKDVMARSPNLRVVLMSATMDATKFAEYFAAESGGRPCPVLEIPGFTHPVRELYLEDAVRLCEYSLRPGSDFARKGPPGGGGGKGGGFDGKTEEQRRAEEQAERTEMAAAEALTKRGYPRHVADCVRDTDPDAINYELLEALLERLVVDQADDGAVLVFLPGLMEISTLHEACTANRTIHGATGGGKYLIALHSQLSTQEQQRVFENPPKGTRKVALATNIAETSITIDDCTVVVDCGKVKETGFNAATRMCIRLFSRHRHDALFAEYQTPEILRVPLDSLTLAVKLQQGSGIDPRVFLSRCVDPPEPDAIDAAISELTSLGALAPADEAMTALGSHLALLPVDPRIGKMLVYGALMGCVEPVLTIAAAMSTRSPFVAPLDKRDEADAVRKGVYGREQSDLLASLRGYDAWEEARLGGGWAAARELARDHFMSLRAMEGISQARRQFRMLLEDARLVLRPRRAGAGTGRGRKGGRGQGRQQQPAPADGLGDAEPPPRAGEANQNAGNAKLVKAVIVAGLYPNVARAEPSRTPGSPPKISVRVPGKKKEEPAALHPSSVCADVPRLHSRYLAYHEMVATSQIYLRDATAVSPYSLLLFGGAIDVQHASGTVTLDGSLAFRCNPRVALLFRELRARLDAELARKIAEPDSDLSSSAASVVGVVCELLEGEVEVAPAAAASGGGGGAAGRGGSGGGGGGRGKGRGGGRGDRARGRGGRGRGRSRR